MMLRKLWLSLFFAAVLALTFPTAGFSAEDMSGFGVGFSNQGHSAFGDDSVAGDMNGDIISDIEPAAGESLLHDDIIAPDVEEALEQEFNTEVTRTVIDRGDGETLTRDRVGEGEIGIFYDHNRDERIMDSDDTIGIEMKLLEFK